METRETRRPNPGRKRPAQKKRPSRQSTGTMPPERRKRSGEDSQRRSRPKSQTRQRRVVRAPKEDIPSVVYTAPKPLGRSRFILRLISMAAVVVAVLMGISVFFRVDTVTVAGAQQYTPWMIREAAGIEDGDSLLMMGRARVAGRIKDKLPYVNDVKVTIHLPGTVSIEITEFPVSYAIQSAGGSWWLITSDGGAVEKISAADAPGYTQILGIRIQEPQQGKIIQAAPEATEILGEEGTIETQMDDSTPKQKLEAALVILENLENSRIIGGIINLDVTDVSEILLQYSQYIRVCLGDNRRLDYKISYMAAAVNQLDPYQNGVLDLSFAYSDDALFTPET